MSMLGNLASAFLLGIISTFAIHLTSKTVGLYLLDEDSKKLSRREFIHYSLIFFLFFFWVISSS